METLRPAVLPNTFFSIISLGLGSFVTGPLFFPFWNGLEEEASDSNL